MNLWRVAIDETTGRTNGEAQPLTAPASYVSNFTLSADGRIGAYLALSGAGNIGRVAFDPVRGAVTGTAEAITVGTHDFFTGYLDVTRDGRFVVATTSARGQEDLYLISTADGAIRQLTNDFFRDRAPRWTDDDRRVLFYSDRSGQYAIWSIDADGGGLR
jgi:Tol biopolymer transport system component